MTIQYIALNKLVPSPVNVRKTGAHIGIDELAASIAAHGLLQNLQVRRVNGNGKYEVIAGGRRLAALKLLVKQKSIAKTKEIPCNLLEDEDVTEVSLAENIVRTQMHPADQFDAFRAMADRGRGDEEIAARFGVTASVVRQRLKLARVSPALLALYRNEEMTLDHLMAFAVSDDHETQMAVWEKLSHFNRTPSAIRRALTEAHVEADDRRVIFVGLNAYSAAGGPIVRDLFQPEHEGYLTDAALLDRLVSEKLEREAEGVRAEGWKWVEIAPEFDLYGLRGFERTEPQTVPLPARDAEELERLEVEYEELADDESGDAIIEGRLEALQVRIDQLAAQQEEWSDGDKALSGAIVTVGLDGRLRIERGLRRANEEVGETASESTGPDVEVDTLPVEAKKAGNGLSARLVEDLTAQRTAALRALLADDDKTALLALAHALVLPVFYLGAGTQSCLKIVASSPALRSSCELIDGTKAGLRLEEREAAMRALLPERPDHLWTWLVEAESSVVMKLLSFCAAMSLDAVQRPHETSDRRMAASSCLARSLRLDMSQWWEPTRETYLGRVAKARILEAVKDGVSAEAADNLADLAKDKLVERASERLAGVGWLPPILRS